MEKFLEKKRGRMKKHRITIAGIGYVGLANAVLLSRNNHVIVYDIVPERAEKLNKRISPAVDTVTQDIWLPNCWI